MLGTAPEAGILASAMTTSHQQSARELGQRMADKASALLEALGPDQRASVSFDFDNDAERTNWAYYPRVHSGLPLLEMDGAQQKLAHELLASAVSLHAYGKVTAIMALESVLNHMEGRQLDAMRDPGRYFFSIFGVPGADRWGWRIEGHHVCLNFTLAGGDVVSSTPNFLGANPAEVRHGDTVVLRPCGEEEDAARALLASLDGDQRKQAIICERAPPDFVLMNVPEIPDACLPGDAGELPFIQDQLLAMPPEDRQALRFDRAQPLGLPESGMNAEQRALLSRLVSAYIERLPEPLRAAERAAAEAIHFAWAGEIERGRPHYYRLQSPTCLVEYDNTQNDANHVHAVWRDPERDFGRDLLREHLQRAH